MMHYEGCQITVFDANGESAWSAISGTARARGLRTTVIAGREVLVVSDGVSGGWTLYLARARPNVLICGTDRAYVAEVLRRIAGKGGDYRQFSRDLPEWREVDTDAPVWAIRHFDKSRAKSDFSSPLAPFPEGDDRADKSAVGVVFSYRWSDDARVATIHYLSNASDVVSLCRRRWANPSWEPGSRVRRTGSRVAEAQTRITGDRDGLHFVIQAMWILGHGVVI